MMRFEDKVVIITGASSGIGEPKNSWRKAPWLLDAALNLRCISRMNMRFMSRRT